MVETAGLKDMTIRDGATGERRTGSLLWPSDPHRPLEAAKRTLRASVDWIQRLERIGLPYCRAHAENRKVPWLRVVH